MLREAGFFILASFASLVGSILAAPAPANSAAPPDYGELLAKYVTTEGVRYDAWHGNPDDLARLREVTRFYAESAPPRDRNAALAWHLNAYNAWILRKILEKYPTEGPLSGGDLRFFHRKSITVGGEEMSFDHLEQKLIRPVFDEPRIHFAVNCASVSCPPLQARPFLAETLEPDLDHVTRQFVNDPQQGAREEGGKVFLSKIFDWYGDDFGGKEAVVAWVNRYRNDPLPATSKPKFMRYDWSLNQAE